MAWKDDLTAEQYHQIIDRDSHHSMQEWLSDPKTYIIRRVLGQKVEKKSTQDMVIGSATHCMLFEPDKFDSRYATLFEKVDRRTKAGRERWLDFVSGNDGKEFLDPDWYDTVVRMVAAVKSHQIAGILADFEGFCERPIFWEDPETGLPMRMMADKIIPEMRGSSWCVDLKTVPDYQALRNFDRTMHKWEYHRQAALYIDGIWHGINLEVSFIWIVVTKSDPTYVAAYVLQDDNDDQTMRIARQDNLTVMRDLARRRRENDWKLDIDVQPIGVSLPFYALKG